MSTPTIVSEPAAPQPSPTNHITDATVKIGKDYLSIESNGDVRYTRIARSDGRPLGLVQSAAWSIDVDSGVGHCHVVTIAAPSNLRALLSDCTLRAKPAPGYHPLRYLYDYYATKLHLLLHPAPSAAANLA